MLGSLKVFGESLSKPLES